jgi:hypothetical protein
VCQRVCGPTSRMRGSWSSVWVCRRSGTLIHQATVVGQAMTGRMPPGPGGPLAGGAPPADRGPGGELWGHHECHFCICIGL